MKRKQQNKNLVQSCDNLKIIFCFYIQKINITNKIVIMHCSRILICTKPILIIPMLHQICYTYYNYFIHT